MKKFFSNIKISFLSLIGLFVPMPLYETGLDKNGNLTNKKLKWTFTIQVGYIPLGWIIAGISLIINKLL